MKTEIENYVKVIETEGDAFVAEFCFPAVFTGFGGHFPEQPILPGVCLVQAVLVAAEKAVGKPLDLTDVALAKFIAMVQPDDLLTARYSVDSEMIRAKITRDNDRVAEIRLKVCGA